MLATSRERILAMLDEDALVLDVGGWARPFSRANWVIDLMPYETRGMYGERDPEQERFGAGTWVKRDFCDREPWPFEDGQFDFVICSQTLEDVRDPIWVCSEMGRVAHAGYIEVPSRLEEQSFGVNGPWVGWSHHHWLCDVRESGIEFVFKAAVLQGRPEYQLTRKQAAALTDEERVQTIFWEGRLAARERVFLGPGEIDDYLAAGVAGQAAELVARTKRPAGGRLRGAAGWIARRLYR